jgi:hypothetical protein
VSTHRLELTRLAPWQIAAIRSPYTHTAMLGGIASGKSFTIAHKVLDHFFERPHLTGVIGANSYEQLSAATLREIMKWLDEYRIPYVLGKRPPGAWAVQRLVKNYQNVLSIRNPWTGAVQTASTVLNLAKNALNLFESSETEEKRALLNYLLQNYVVDGKKPMFTLRSPFDSILSVATQPTGLRG